MRVLEQRLIRWMRGALLVGIALLQGGCSGWFGGAATLIDVVPTDYGLRARFDRPVEISEARLTSADGHLVARLPLAGRRAEFDLPVSLEPGQHYIVAFVARGATWREPLRVPDRKGPLRGVIELPLGQVAVELGGTSEAVTDATRLLLPERGIMSLGLSIENREQAPVEFELELAWESGVRLSFESSEWQVEPDRAVVRGRTEFEFDTVQHVAELELRPGAGAATLRGTLRQQFGQPPVLVEQQLVIELVSRPLEEIAAQVECRQVVFPADPWGDRDLDRLADTVVLPNPLWRAVRRAILPTGGYEDRYAAYGDQAIHLVNHSQLALNLVLETAVRRADRDEWLLDFSPPAWKSPRESPLAYQVARLPAGAHDFARVPLYVRPEVRPGSYERLVRATLLGSHETLWELRLPLEVVQASPRVSAIVLATLVGSLAAWIVFMLRGRRWIAALGTEGLVTIALVGSLHFAVSYGARIFGDLVAAVTGPFYLFVAGVAAEGLTSLLLAVALVLLPRPGTLLLSGLTVFLLNAMFTGQFGPVDVLFVTVSITLGEVLAAALGITTFARLGGHQAFAPLHATLRVALALGVANAATLYTQYCLLEVLYRLYFAGWFVAAVCLVTGLGYGTVGAALGTSVGYRLRSVAR